MRRRSRFPWWGLLPIALPWLWFAVRDANGVTDLVAIGLPALAVVALAVAGVFLGLGRWVPAAAAGSLFVMCLVAVALPRLPVRTGEPAPGITVVADNVLSTNRWPGPAVAAMTAPGADVMVAVEMGRRFVAHMREDTDRYAYHARSGTQGIWSRWPVTELPAPAGLPADRVGRFAIDTARMRIVVYAVHLPNPLHEVSFQTQHEMVERLAGAVEDEADPAIVAGDLNLSDRGAGYRTLEGSMRDAMRTGWWADGTYRYGSWRALSLRIDHLFVPTGWCTAHARTFPVPGSDHRAIGATVGPCAA